MKIGEMEKDCLFSHGINSILTEKIYDNSDNFDIIYCKLCGYRADSNI